jgi:hypothetical protein
MAQPRNRPAPRNSQHAGGDFTGRERDRLAQEKADEVIEAQKRVGLVGQMDSIVEDEGVFDPTSNEIISLPDSAQTRIEEVQEVSFAQEEPLNPLEDPQTQRVNLMRDFQSAETQQATKVLSHNPYEVEEANVEVVEEPFKFCKVNSDVEQMTFGAGQIIDLWRGRTYKLPMALYKHLESKGLIWH